MRLVCLSDTHGLHREVRLPPGDVLVHAGDLSAHGRLDEVASFLNWFPRSGRGVDPRERPLPERLGGHPRGPLVLGQPGDPSVPSLSVQQE